MWAAAFDCTFPDGPDSTDVKIKVQDSDGASGVGLRGRRASSTVANVASDGDAGEQRPRGRGFAGDDDVLEPARPSPTDTTAGFHYAYSCDGLRPGRRDLCHSRTTSPTTCTYDDGPSTHTVRARIIDKDNGFTEYTTTVTVNNVDPTATLSNDGPVTRPRRRRSRSRRSPIRRRRIRRPGFHYAYGCDNGSLAAATYAGSGTAASHQCTFADNGTYTVQGADHRQGRRLQRVHDRRVR